jgi:hypothetical protein
VSISHVVVLAAALVALPCALMLVARQAGHRRMRPAERPALPGADLRVGSTRQSRSRRNSAERQSRSHCNSAERQMQSAWRGNRADRQALRRVDRTINQPPAVDRLTIERRLPPVEQIAAELRRLDRQRRHGLSNESEKWSAAVASAYDAWLLAACRRLNISEHLSSLAGIDRDIERVRVEGQLQTAGLILR